MERHVDPGRADHLLARDPLRLARKQADRAHAVAADVHHRAAVELGQRADVREVVERERERRLDHLEAADRTADDEVPYDGGLGMVAVHERLHQHEPLRVGDRERRLCLGGATCYGFSTRTCLPASSACIVHSWCIPLGKPM